MLEGGGLGDGGGLGSGRKRLPLQRRQRRRRHRRFEDLVGAVSTLYARMIAGDGALKILREMRTFRRGGSVGGGERYGERRDSTMKGEGSRPTAAL